MTTHAMTGSDDVLELPGIQFSEWHSRLGPLLQEAGEPLFRRKQILSWVFQRGAQSFAAMDDLPKSLRERLAQKSVLHPLEIEREQRSLDGTRKFLWRRLRGESVESVWIPDGDRDTYCISSQSGCAVACTFCATGHSGFDGQLTAAEIVDQVLIMRRVTDTPPTNIVFMGMGEPLLNMPNVLRSIGILCHCEQVGVGARRITVSTVGVAGRIVELARAHPQVKLAVSLHAARDELRSKLIPLNRTYPLTRLLDSIREHHAITGKKVTFEYVVLPGVNDQPRDIGDLSRILDGIPSRINLLGFNPFPGARHRRPTVPQIVRFRDALARQFPGPVTIRRSRGEDIDGACGQLAGRQGDKKKAPDSESRNPEQGGKKRQ